MTRRPETKRPLLLFTVNDAGFFLSHRLPIAQAAAAAGYDVQVATAPGPAAARVLTEGFAHHAVPLSRRGLNPFAELRALWALTRLYRQLKPDLIHHVTIKPVLIGGIAARLARTPAMVSAVSGLGYVFIKPGWPARMLRLAVRSGYRLALRRPGVRVIFQNPDDRHEFVGQKLIDPNAAVLIKGSGVNTAQFVVRPEPEGVPLVVLPARMLRDKGVGEFVKAARSLRAQGVEARFALVGDSDPGNPTAIPESRLRAWQDKGDVEWWGHSADMATVLTQAHIVCLPSYREGLPKSLIEAAACGRAIVACDVPGCREIARHDENALLVPPRDPIALAEALRKLITDSELRQRMGRRGRSMVEAEFSLERVVAETLATYAVLLRETGGRAPLAAQEDSLRCSPS
jgi:glycosyltransferase involved in cell wall biosynthesis